jgi:hypothetical protein
MSPIYWRSLIDQLVDIAGADDRVAAGIADAATECGLLFADAQSHGRGLAGGLEALRVPSPAQDDVWQRLASTREACADVVTRGLVSDERVAAAIADIAGACTDALLSLTGQRSGPAD